MTTRVEQHAAFLAKRRASHSEVSRAAPTPTPAVSRGIRAALRGWWLRRGMDERTVYLSQATSHDDLERRMRAWCDADRRRRMPLV